MFLRLTEVRSARHMPAVPAETRKIAHIEGAPKQLIFAKQFA